MKKFFQLKDMKLRWTCINSEFCCHMEMDGVVKTLKEWKPILKHILTEGCHCYLEPLVKTK